MLSDSKTYENNNTTNRSGYYNYYHWQSTEPRPANHQIESNRSFSPQQQPPSKSVYPGASQSPFSNCTQLRNTIAKLATKPERSLRTNNNISCLFSPTSSTQSYQTYQTISISNSSEPLKDLDTSSNGTLNGSASGYLTQHQQPVALKTPSSLTLYTYLLETNKSSSKDVKSSVIRSQTKKFNYEHAYMKNLVPKVQKLNFNSSPSHQPDQVAQPKKAAKSGDDSSSNFSSKINYKLFSGNNSKLTSKMSSLQCRSESSAS